MFGVGAGELVVIVFIALLIFGPQRIPEIARAVAKGYRELTRLRRQMDNTLDEVKRDLRLDEELDRLDERDRAAELRMPADARSPVGTARGRPGPATTGPYEAGDRGLFEPLPVPAEDDYLAPEPPAPDYGANPAEDVVVEPEDDYLGQRDAQEQGR